MFFSFSRASLASLVLPLNLSNPFFTTSIRLVSNKPRAISATIAAVLTAPRIGTIEPRTFPNIPATLPPIDNAFDNLPTSPAVPAVALATLATCPALIAIERVDFVATFLVVPANTEPAPPATFLILTPFTRLIALNRLLIPVICFLVARIALIEPRTIVV